MDSYQFLHLRARYHGDVPPERPEVLLFDANLQEFAQRVGYISCLETGGKISPEAAYSEIQSLWKNLQKTSQSLGISSGDSNST